MAAVDGQSREGKEKEMRMILQSDQTSFFRGYSNTPLLFLCSLRGIRHGDNYLLRVVLLDCSLFCDGAKLDGLGGVFDVLFHVSLHDFLHWTEDTSESSSIDGKYFQCSLGFHSCLTWLGC